MGKGKHAVNTDKPLPDPPDGGWGWMVVLGSFLLHVIADGIVYSFGVFYIEFLEYFGTGKGETSWVGSLVPGVTLTVGPLASALTNRYGCRKVTIIGAVIASIGFILSLFAPNIYYLYVTFGILSGLGFGLMYLPAIVSVGYYFEKKRSFATGLAVCGSGLGTFIFAPLSKYLVDEYQWQGAALIEAAIILNCVICGALFRPLTYEDSKKEKYDGKSNNMKSEEEALMLETNKQHANHPRMPLEIKSQQNISVNKIDRLKVEEKNGNMILARSEGDIHHLNGNISPSSTRNTFTRQSSQPHSPVNAPGPLYRKDIFYSGSIYNIPEFRSNPDNYITSVQSLPDLIPEEEDWKIFRCLNLSPQFRDTIRHMLDFSLLKDIIFLLFVISNFCTSIGFNMPYIYLPDRAKDAGIDENKGAFLVSVIGIANTVGRVIFGWISDKPWVNRLMLYNTALTICGIATALSPVSDSYEFLVVYAAIFGAFIGVYVGLTSVVLVDLLGLDKLTSSFGLLLMFQGVATLIGPPIAGWLYDGTGSYNISFHVAGTVVAISGSMLYLIPLIQKCLGRSSVIVHREIDIKEPSDNGNNETEMQTVVSA
ncbi:hypothetical protein KUTeg_011833 [Tegillarca granosa]|uniref:Major facilitator superfamily (MFS) profile domain-containing protein n=1 Tax=Tegillarca granosa TaxID=220873 RepID=A0ABQ9EXT6_TEGGR|nr:hypothetical protein KUTeg_011833 [Tegillarca granosa]